MHRWRFLALPAGIALALASSGALDRPDAQTGDDVIRGTVRCGREYLAGVRVSDGCRVVLTDRRGRYELPIGPNSGRFVFITTPRDYWTDAFCVPLAEALEGSRTDFELRPLPQQDRFSFVFITDMHLEGAGHRIRKLRASIAEINDLRPRPAFVWAQGDISLQGGAGPDYIDCMSALEMPVRNGAGNHEMMMDKDNPREDFEALFGPTYYSFDWGKLHCIVLDGNKVIPGDSGWQNVHGAIEGSELAWLKADLAATPSDMPIICGIHIPLVTTYPERRGHEPDGAPYWEVTNADEVIDLLSRYDVRLMLQGHMHENERITVKGIEFVESISLCGSWWKAGEGFERGVDGTPRGYRIVEVDGSKVTHRYVSSAESRVDREAEFVNLAHGILADEEASFILNCYDAPNTAVAEGRIDGGPWHKMPSSPHLNAELSLTMPHHFALVADMAALGPGEHVVEGVVRWPGGRVRHSEHFQVRDTTVPRADELTDSADGWQAEGTCRITAEQQAEVGEHCLRFDILTADYGGNGCDIWRETGPIDLSTANALRFRMKLAGLREGQYVHFQLRSQGAIWNFQREGDTQPRGNFGWREFELALTDPPEGFDLSSIDTIALILQGNPQGGQSVWLDGLEFVAH
jgi:UDP-2,3-diacylglucosamine pyrophosphatase LpxH